MRYLLLVFAMFSFGFAPVMAAETCADNLDMSVSIHADKVMLGTDMMDCCDSPDRAVDDLPDDCVSECAASCAGVFAGITPFLGAYKYEAIASLSQRPPNSVWLAQDVSFDPPPPRI